MSEGASDLPPAQTVSNDDGGDYESWDEGLWNGSDSNITPYLPDDGPAPTRTVTSSLTGAIEFGASAALESKLEASFESGVPRPQHHHAELMVRVAALEAAIRHLGPTRLGHNNPPSPIDSAPEFTAEQIAAILRATATFARQPPAPTTVPQEVDQARKTLGRLYLEGFVQRAGELTAETLASWAKTGGRALIWYLLYRVIEASDLWAEAIKLLAKSASH